MGFFNKLWNLIRGRGFSEEEIKTETATEPKPITTTETTKPEPKTEKPTETTKQETRKPETETKPTGIKPPKKDEIQKATETYAKHPSKAEIEKKIKPEGVNRITIEQQSFADIGQLKPKYEQIFTENAKLTDPDILNVLIENRQQLQHRFQAEFIIELNGAYAGTLTVAGILMEHMGYIHNYLNIGQQLESELKTYLEQVLKGFESTFGAIGGNVVTVKEFGTITDIKKDLTYA